MLAVLAGSVSLAGLLLIFAGLLFAQAAAFPKDTTPDDLIDRFRNAGRSVLWPFLLSLLIAALCLAWLLRSSPALYAVAWIGFGVLLIGTAGYGFWVIRRLL